MNILYINHYAGSLEMGMEFRPYYLAREWIRMGHKVRIIAASYSHLRKMNPIVNEDMKIQIIDGIEYQWIKTSSYVGNGIARAINMFQFCGKLEKNAKRIANEFNPDLVISSSTYPLDTYPAQKIKKIAKCKYIHEGHDIWPLTLIVLGGMNKKHPFVRLLSFAEKSAYKHANKVVSVLPNSIEHMLCNGLQNASKFEWIPNGVVEDDWKNPEALNQSLVTLINSQHENGRFVIGYIGGYGIANGIDTLIHAASKLKECSNISYILIGKGPNKSNLQKMAEEKGISNMFFVDAIPKKQVPSAMYNMDALYIGMPKSELYRYGVSLNKVPEYMMAGKPILYSIDSPNREIADAGCGIVIPAEDATALSEAIVNLSSMGEDERHRMGENGRRWVLNNMEYKILAKKFIEIS